MIKRIMMVMLIMVLGIGMVLPISQVNASKFETACDSGHPSQGVHFECYHMTNNEVKNLSFKPLDKQDGTINFDGSLGIDRITINSNGNSGKYDITIDTNSSFPEGGKIGILLENGYVAVNSRDANGGGKIKMINLVSKPIMFGLIGGGKGMICSTDIRKYNIDFSFVIDTSGSMADNDPKKLRVSSTKEFLDSEGVIENDRFNLVTFASIPESFMLKGNTISKTISKSGNSVDVSKYVDKIKNDQLIKNEKALKYFYVNSKYMIYDYYFRYYNNADRNDYYNLTINYESIKNDGGRLFTEDKNKVKSILDYAGDANGGTNIGIGLKDAINNLSHFNDGNEKVIILLTDGNHETAFNESDMDNFAKSQSLKAKEEGIVVYTIGLGNKRNLNEELLASIAFETGGEYFHVNTSEELSDVYRSISEITKCEIIGHHVDPPEKIEGVIINNSCVLDDNRVRWEIENKSDKNYSDLEYEILPSLEKNKFNINSATIIHLITDKGGFMKIFKDNQTVITANSSHTKCNDPGDGDIVLICAPPPVIVDNEFKFPSADYLLNTKIFLEESILGNSYYINMSRDNVDDGKIPNPKGILY